MASIRHYFYSLSHRERLVVMVGGIAVAGILFYSFVWEPLHLEVQRLRQVVPQLQSEFARMQKEERRIQPLIQRAKFQTANKGDQPILTVIERTAKAAKVQTFIKRIQPDKDNTVKVWMSSIAFDSWLLWIDNLKKENIDVVAAVVNRSEKNTVNIRVTFVRAV